MRPMCQTILRSQKEEKPPETPTVVVHRPDSTFLETPERINSSPEPGMSPSGPHNRRDREQPSGGSELKTPAPIKPSKTSHGDAVPSQQGKSSRRQPPRRQSRSSEKHNISPSRRNGFQSPCNVYLFMPYLHFETDKNRKAMLRACAYTNGQYGDSRHVVDT